MKKICLLFVIAILLTGTVVILERLNVKKKINDKPGSCLAEENCGFLERYKQPKSILPLDKAIKEDSDEDNNIVNINEAEDYNYSDDQEADSNEADSNEENSNEADSNEENSNEEDDIQEEPDNEFNGASLTFGQIDYENNSIEIFMINNEEVAGFQFSLSSNNNGLIVIGAFGGLADEYEMDVMIGEGTNIILGISLEGNRIALANDVLTNLSFETLNTTDTEICISDLIISNAASDNITTVEQFCTNLN